MGISPSVVDYAEFDRCIVRGGRMEYGNGNRSRFGVPSNNQSPNVSGILKMIRLERNRSGVVSQLSVPLEFVGAKTAWSFNAIASHTRAFFPGWDIAWIDNGVTFKIFKNHA